MTQIYQNGNFSDQVMAELLINFPRGTDEILTSGNTVSTGRPLTASSGIDRLQELIAFRKLCLLIIPVMKCSFPFIFWCNFSYGDMKSNFLF